MTYQARSVGHFRSVGMRETLRSEVSLSPWVRSTGNRVATTSSLSAMAAEAGSASVIARERSNNFTNSGRKPSPRWAARDLHGALFLVHGAVDDNVHVSNTMQFAYELQKAEKPFQMMLYPKARHGVTDPAQVMHLRTAMLAFVLDHLKPEQTPVPRRTASGRP